MNNMKTPKEILDKYDISNGDESVIRLIIECAMQEYADQFKEKPKKSIEERNSIFFESVHSVIMKHNMDIPKIQIQDFMDYWTEISPNARKMRFEKEKVFDIKKRLERWKRNQKPTTNGTTTSEAIANFITQ